MPSRQLISPQSRATLFDPPTDPAALVRHYTFSSEDLALIRQRRRDANRLGFAVHLAYLRFPGRVLGAGETPAADMLAFVASQLQPEIFTRLKSGGPQNGNEVQTVIFKSGAAFPPSGKPFTGVTFKQS